MKQSNEQDIQRLFATKVSFCYRESDDSRSKVPKEKSEGKDVSKTVVLL
ncbi:transposase, IS605 OrfB family domain protein [Geobacillus kaustophilus]|uniref:Transposase, IS605 OrfB family domain protein n=1 Tax=Geobacillus kaustophilus TaxID=1462 RepID=A0A0D8BQU7_GEOKU|nr:transposase, IS605 OrfB family domain protein [Geobacillus kaustophilus]